MPSLSIAKTTQLNRVSFSERSVEKIRAANLLDRVIKYCKGELQLDGKQVDTHLKLINKILPDLQAVQHDVSVSHNIQDIHTLNAKLSALGHDPNQVWQSIANNQPVTIDVKPVEKVNPESD